MKWMIQMFLRMTPHLRSGFWKTNKKGTFQKNIRKVGEMLDYDNEMPIILCPFKF